MKYRDNDAIGALLDEYERSIQQLKVLLTDVSDEELITIVDANTNNLDCRSIQSILTHVFAASYNYIVEIRWSQGEDLEGKQKALLSSISEYSQGLDEAFFFNANLFDDYPALPLEESDPSKKMKLSWGQSYDAEQLLEHATVHILRHRRQIERFLLKLRV